MEFTWYFFITFAAKIDFADVISFTVAAIKNWRTVKAFLLNTCSIPLD